MNSITYNQILNTAFLTVLRCLCFYLVYVPRIICIAANSLNNNLSKAELPTSEGAEMISVSSQGTPNIQKISLITFLLLKFILLAASSKKIVIRSPENGKEKNIQGHRRAKIGDFDSLIGHSTGTASPENIPIPGGIRAKVSLQGPGRGVKYRPIQLLQSTALKSVGLPILQSTAETQSINFGYLHTKQEDVRLPPEVLVDDMSQSEQCID